MKNTVFTSLLAVACLVNVFSCKQKKEDPDINSLAFKFSELECRAFTLREERYSLADRIRFTEDSVSKAPAASKAKESLQSRLNGYLKDKENILSSSMRLADTINLQLDSIIKIQLHSREQINLFDQALSLELQKRHCK